MDGELLEEKRRPYQARQPQREPGEARRHRPGRQRRVDEAQRGVTVERGVCPEIEAPEERGVALLVRDHVAYPGGERCLAAALEPGKQRARNRVAQGELEVQELLVDVRCVKLVVAHALPRVEEAVRRRVKKLREVLRHEMPPEVQ